MSGGFFDNYSFLMDIERFENKLKYEGGRYSEATQKELQSCLRKLMEANICLRRVDYFFAGDDDEESFVQRLQEELEKFSNMPDVELGIPNCSKCQHNSEVSLRHRYSGSYVETGCDFIDDCWPDNASECYCFKHVNDYEN